MARSSVPFLTAGMALIAATLVSADDNAREQAIKKDRKQMEGVWRAVSLEVNGNKAAENDDKQISKGTNKIDPTRKPKTIDFTPTEGEGKGKEFVGIYELGKHRRKLCFVEAGKDRPGEFVSAVGSERILVIFERDK